jgi:hypothetical protein
MDELAVVKQELADEREFVQQIAEALRAAGHPTHAPTPGPDGDDGYSHLLALDDLVKERDALKAELAEEEE